MALYLVNPSVEMSLELYVSTRLEEALTIQYERIRDRRVRDTFVRKLEQRLESLLADSVDWDLKAPTEAQLNYAKLVSKQLGIPLPIEAQKYRFHTAISLRLTRRWREPQEAKRSVLRTRPLRRLLCGLWKRRRIRLALKF